MEFHLEKISPEHLLRLHEVSKRHNDINKRAPRVQISSSEWVEDDGYVVKIIVSTAFRDAPITPTLVLEVLEASGEVRAA